MVFHGFTKDTQIVNRTTGRSLIGVGLTGVEESLYIRRSQNACMNCLRPDFVAHAWVTARPTSISEIGFPMAPRLCIGIVLDTEQARLPGIKSHTTLLELGST